VEIRVELVQLTLVVLVVQSYIWTSAYLEHGGAGGSGIIVIVRAPGQQDISASPGTNTVTTLPAPAGGCKVATWHSFWRFVNLHFS
jgi:hypothetical protein